MVFVLVVVLGGVSVRNGGRFQVMSLGLQVSLR